MWKAGKWGIVLVLALTPGFVLFVPDAFVQSVKTDQQQTKIATMTTVPQVATPTQQATEKLSLIRRGRGFYRHFFCRRHCFFRHHRFFHHRFFPDCDVGCGCDFW